MNKGNNGMKNYELIIFDLDGTLLDTSQGIFNSVRYAEKEMGFEPVAEEKLKEFVGPPPKTMYMSVYHVDEKVALKAAKKHREYGKTRAIYEAKVYPGMAEVLGRLKEMNYKLAVATLKSQSIAETVLMHYGLKKYFDAVIGMDDRESLTKCETIQLAIEKTKSSGRVLMVGDSMYDYVGATEAQVDFLGVLYGFGFKREEKYLFPVVEDVEKLLDAIVY